MATDDFLNILEDLCRQTDYSAAALKTSIEYAAETGKSRICLFGTFITLDVAEEVLRRIEGG